MGTGSRPILVVLRIAVFIGVLHGRRPSRHDARHRCGLRFGMVLAAVAVAGRLWRTSAGSLRRSPGRRPDDDDGDSFASGRVWKTVCSDRFHVGFCYGCLLPASAVVDGAPSTRSISAAARWASASARRMWDRAWKKVRCASSTSRKLNCPARSLCWLPYRRLERRAEFPFAAS